VDLKLLGSSPWQWSITFAPEDSCFIGHFPAQPVVPGTYILALCMHCLHAITSCKTLAVERFSFLRFADPGDYVLSIIPDNNVFRCTLSQGALVFAQGSIALCV